MRRLLRLRLLRFAPKVGCGKDHWIVFLMNFGVQWLNGLEEAGLFEREPRGSPVIR
jgi:hypothetical protein